VCACDCREILYDKDTVCVLGAASREILYDIHTVCVGGNSTLYIHARTSTASKLIDAYSGIDELTSCICSMRTVASSYIHARTSTDSKLIDAYSGTSISGLIYLCVCV
jgi:hypothetical protein